MKSITDLEALIRRLAGRDGPGTAGNSPLEDRIEAQLGDPSSDASRFLDEIRQRTRSLFDDSTGSPLTPSVRPRRLDLNPLFEASVGPPKKRWPRPGWLILAVGLIASMAVTGGLIWRAADRLLAARSREQTERILVELRTRFVAPPTIASANLGNRDAITVTNDLGVRRWEVEFASINAKLDAMGRSIASVALQSARTQTDPKIGSASPTTAVVAAPDPNYPVISADLAAIRRELTNSEAATARQIQEMRTVLQEVNTVVRRVLSRPQTSVGNNVAISVLAVAVQALINNLQHPSAQVRGEAVEQLVRIGTPARSAIPALQQMLGRETDPNIRSAIETALTVLSSN